MRAANNLIKFLSSEGKKLSPILILTHDYPDPDAIASAFALQHLANSVCGIQSRIAYGGIIGRTENQTMIRILKIPIYPLRQQYDFKKFEHVALVDTQPPFSNNSFPKKSKATLVIDHHPIASLRSSKLSIIDTEAGATSVILAQALLHLKKKIPTKLATALAYGIVSETQDLGRETQALDIKTYREILPQCNIKSLSMIRNPRRPRNFFQTLNRSINKAFVSESLIGAHLGFIDTPDLVSQMADFLLTYEGTRWSVCTGRYEQKLHISLRTVEPKIHAGRLLQFVLVKKERAGGHKSMAGGSLPLKPFASESDWKKAENQTTKRLLRRLFKNRLPRFCFPFQVQKEQG